MDLNLSFPLSFTPRDSSSSPFSLLTFPLFFLHLPPLSWASLALRPFFLSFHPPVSPCIMTFLFLIHVSLIRPSSASFSFFPVRCTQSPFLSLLFSPLLSFWLPSVPLFFSSLPIPLPGLPCLTLCSYSYSRYLLVSSSLRSY